MSIVLRAVNYIKINRIVSDRELREWYYNNITEYDFHYFLTRLILSRRIKKGVVGYILL